MATSIRHRLAQLSREAINLNATRLHSNNNSLRAYATQKLHEVAETAMILHSLEAANVEAHKEDSKVLAWLKS